MKLIVGLGNPGVEYNMTRHNIGFMFLDYYLNKNNIPVKWSKKMNGLYFEFFIGNEKVIFLKPQTYMNLSGDAVSCFVHYFHIDIDDILIISDDLDLKVGNYKLKPSGSCGGHNGLRSIETNLGSSNYKRLKIGISKSNNLDTKDYVLGVFSKDEQSVIFSLFDNLCGLLDDYFILSFSDLMNKYNRKNK